MSTPKVAVVTGASSGIGRATALQLARAGFVVAAAARTRAALDALAAEANANNSGGRVVAYAVDAGDAKAVAVFKDAVVAELGVPDVVVNSAGLGQWKYLEDTTPAELQQMMGAPFFAAAFVTQAFLKSMIAKKSGRILHVGSPASLQPWPGSTAYATSRWALRGLHESLVMDLRDTGVTSTHVLFGEVTSSYFDNNPGSHEHIPKVGSIIPKMTPEQCATALVSLATSTSEPPTTVFHPFLLRLFFWFRVIFPGIFRAAVWATGRKR